MKKTFALVLCALMLLVPLASCGENADNGAKENGATNETADNEKNEEKEENSTMAGEIYKDVTPEENSNTINLLKEFILENNINVYSVNVTVGDKSETFAPRFGNACNDSYSVAKVYTLTAIGMLVDEGKLKTDDLIYTYFKDEMGDWVDENWKTVTVENVIAHKIGLGRGCLDIDMEEIENEDFLDELFSMELFYEPGTEYVYSDGAYYLLSRLVTKISGEKLDDFLMERLFVPMGVREAAWSNCPKGYPMGATGLYIRSEDVSKLGIAYLNGGEYDGKTYFSEDWANWVLENGYELGILADGAWGKGGLYGQYMFISKNTNMVISWHSAVQGTDCYFLRDYVLELDKKIAAGEIEQ